MFSLKRHFNDNLTINNKSGPDITGNKHLLFPDIQAISNSVTNNGTSYSKQRIGNDR